ncbi:MAG: hypothetical protein KDA51_02055 [Planctomycetales bacterium]|nr:hypothetical protein [Planctomycetales bacterium]
MPTSQRSILCLLLGNCLVVALATSSLHAQQLDLFSELTQRGLEFTDQQRVTISPATLRPGMTDSERTEALAKLIGKQKWDRFARDSVRAPVVVDIDTIDDPSGERLGMRVHSAFVVYTTLEMLRDRDLMEETFGPAPIDSTRRDTESDRALENDEVRVVMRELPTVELARLGFTRQVQGDASFAYVELPLLNKVLVRGVIRIEKREREGAVELAWRLDPSFNSDEELASRWTRLERDAVGKLVEGDSFPYTGCGGWMGVYEINPEKKQLLVESQLLLREPKDWFAGSNFLRSKLPPALQENAQTFRRKLAK